ncbi:M23 family metallopeptidase [Antribacter gilvus]|uniref:M23 family metallopeptidase n=1 Tax=Antribacter gilvus TaxID=2304675 RepID=UPI000F76E877|nr:M23 family metallopeptidase [Antribacter gilvus]
MRKLLPYLVFPVLLIGPTVGLVIITIVSAMARPTACAPAVTTVPGTLSATTADGITVRLDQVQLTHAATIMRIGAATEGVGRDGVVIALMAALTESRLRMLANTVYPDSATYPHDGVGHDHDSLGLFQMRPAAGWGSVAELMDPVYQARAFFGGRPGPNDGSPRGLLDIPGWESMPKGAAAQAVEVSAHPDRYAAYEPVAEAILTALTTPTATASQASPPAGIVEAAFATAFPASPIVFPLPEGSWRRVSGFGHRVHPVYGTTMLHAGVDYAAPAGTPVLALADGIVTHVLRDERGGNVVVLLHYIGGEMFETAYAHLQDGSVTVQVNDVVAAGEQIAAVGSTGAATGPHLHLEVHPGGWYSPTDPEPWLAAHSPEHLTNATPAACSSGGSR